MEQPERKRSAARRGEALRRVAVGVAVNRVAQDLGISLVTLRNWISTEQAGQERAKHGNPDAAPHDCPDCGRRTKVNLRTGLLYSHSRPRQTVICPASASAVRPPQLERDKPPTLPPLRRPPEPKPSSPQYYDGPSQSVSARPSGLPSLGKRR
ncbi:transposase [Micromonospora rosaria]|uniref:transposase n=1 Tax=Micromonospora rosaria TaxID=47874 RepID=UPI0037CAF276